MIPLVHPGYSLKFFVGFEVSDFFTFYMLSINTNYIGCWAYLCSLLGPNGNYIDRVGLLFHGNEGPSRNQIKSGL